MKLMNISWWTCKWCYKKNWQGGTCYNCGKSGKLESSS